MNKEDAPALDNQPLDLAQAFQLCADTLSDLWRKSIEFIETSFPAFLKLVSQIWDAWLTLFPPDDVWDPWGAALVMIFVILLLTHQIQKLLAPA